MSQFNFKFNLRNEFAKIYAFAILLAFSETFGWSFVYYYLAREKAFGFDVLLAYFALTFGVAGLFMLFVRRYERRTFMCAGIVLKAAVYASVVYVAAPVHLYLLAVVYSASMFMVYVPFNTRYLELTTPSDRAQKSALQFALWAVFGATMPFFTGLVIDSFGYNAAFWTSAGVLLTAELALAVLIKPKPDDAVLCVEPLGTVKKLGRVSYVMFLEGFWTGMVFITIPLYSMLLVQEKLAYGAFLSYLGIFGGVSSVLAGRVSDSVQKRALFIGVFAILMGVAVLLASASSTFTEWAVYTAAITMLLYLILPFTYALIGDMSASIGEGMVARDILLDFGRAAGACAVIAAYIVYNDLKAALLIPATVLFAYPLVVLYAKAK